MSAEAVNARDAHLSKRERPTYAGHMAFHVGTEYDRRLTRREDLRRPGKSPGCVAEIAGRHLRPRSSGEGVGTAWARRRRLQIIQEGARRRATERTLPEIPGAIQAM